MTTAVLSSSSATTRQLQRRKVDRKSPTTRSDRLFGNVDRLKGLDSCDYELPRFNVAVDGLERAHMKLEEEFKEAVNFVRAENTLREGLVAATVKADDVINIICEFVATPPAFPKLARPGCIKRGSNILKRCDDALDYMGCYPVEFIDFNDAWDDAVMVHGFSQQKAKVLCSALEHDGLYFTACPTRLWNSPLFLDLMVSMPTHHYSSKHRVFFEFDIGGVTDFYSIRELEQAISKAAPGEIVVRAFSMGDWSSQIVDAWVGSGQDGIKSRLAELELLNALDALQVEVDYLKDRLTTFNDRVIKLYSHYNSGVAF